MTNEELEEICNNTDCDEHCEYCDVFADYYQENVRREWNTNPSTIVTKQ